MFIGVLVGLAECGTHAVFAAEIGTYAESGTTLAGRQLGALGSGMLLLADRGFFSFALWRQAAATGADLLWRARIDRARPRPAHAGDLPDGSWLAHLGKSTDRRGEPMLVRVVDYSVEDGRDTAEEYRLFTTLHDPDEATATELAATTTSAGRSSSPSMS